MAWYEILIVSVGLSLDVLTYALYKGAELPDDFDDITIERNQRYRWFLDKIQRRINIDWVNIDTSDKDAEHVFREVCN